MSAFHRHIWHIETLSSRPEDEFHRVMIRCLACGAHGSPDDYNAEMEELAALACEMKRD